MKGGMRPKQRWIDTRWNASRVTLAHNARAANANHTQLKHIIELLFEDQKLPAVTCDFILQTFAHNENNNTKADFFLFSRCEDTYTCLQFSSIKNKLMPGFTHSKDAPPLIATHKQETRIRFRHSTNWNRETDCNREAEQTNLSRRNTIRNILVATRSRTSETRCFSWNSCWESPKLLAKWNFSQYRYVRTFPITQKISSPKVRSCKTMGKNQSPENFLQKVRSRVHVLEIFMHQVDVECLNHTDTDPLNANIYVVLVTHTLYCHLGKVLWTLKGQGKGARNHWPNVSQTLPSDMMSQARWLWPNIEADEGEWPALNKTLQDETWDAKSI